MITIRPAQTRGKAVYEAYSSRYSFSFDTFFDPEFVSFGPLFALNENSVNPESEAEIFQFSNIDIIRLVVSGSLEHRSDSGESIRLTRDDVLRFSLEDQSRYRVFNPSTTEPSRNFTIYIVPGSDALKPSFEQAVIPWETRRGSFRLLASQDGRDGSVTICRDIDLFATQMESGEELSFPIRPGRRVWLQVIDGSIQIGDHKVSSGDGVALVDESELKIQALSQASFLTFDIAD